MSKHGNQYGNEGGTGFPGKIHPTGPGNTGGEPGSIGQGGTPQGVGSSRQNPSRSLADNRGAETAVPRVSKKAMADVTDSMR